MKSEVFFFVTTVCIVIISMLVAVAVFYFIKILVDLKQVSKEVKEESHLIIEDAKEMRESFKNNGGLFKTLFYFFTNNKSKRSKSKNKK